MDKQEKALKKEIYKKQYAELIDDVVRSIKELFTGKKLYKAKEANEFIEMFYSEQDKQREEEKKHSKYSKEEQISFVVLALTMVNILLLLICYVIAIVKLNARVFLNSPLYLIPAAALPIMAWIKATNENFWAFHRRKRLFFELTVINAVVVLSQPIYSVCWNIIVPLVLKIPVNPCLTKNMIVFLVYIALFTFLGLIYMIIYRQVEPIILSDTTKRQIELFKYQQIKDDREDREYKYDVTTIMDLDSGKPIRIKENDRFVQTDINGASGTGKTSSIFLNVIRSDMDTKFRNREKRQEELLKLINSGKATIKGPLKEFKESAVIATGKNAKEKKENEKALERIRKKYSDCGITVMAPNSSLNQEIIRMAAARGFQVNVLDPVTNYSAYPNVKEVSINPFYLPLGLDESERVIRISQAASNFADVLIATNQMGGQSDTYFTDISLSVSSNVASVVMLAKNIKGQQAYIDDVHECISDFKNLQEYITIIENYYHISISGKQTFSTNATAESSRKNPYYQQILFVQQELLGAGAEAMFSQERGLRNLVNKILQDPRIKRKLSAKEDYERLDFDGILKNNDITLVSTAIELGQNISTSFGLFFLLLHRTSVLRRPKETRTPHFLWVDECAQYVHPVYDDIIALYRQYRVAAVLTLQTLTQLEKNKATAYLKNVFLGAGTHIVFGRLAVEEMRMYSEMAGINREMQEQKSSTQNSVFASNPTYSESTRYTPTQTNVMEGADMRLLDFQELTIFTLDNGRVLPGKHARVFFLSDDAYDYQPHREIMWERVVPEAFKEKEAAVDEDNEEIDEKTPLLFNDTIAEEDEEIIMIHVDDSMEVLESKEEGKIDKKDDFDEIYKKLMS